MNITFKEQNILVTGGTRGIGKSIALAFVESGAENVVITGTKNESEVKLEELFPEGSLKKIKYRKLNLALSSKNSEIDHLVNEFGHFHVCVNNAGINIVESIDQLGEENLENVLKVNLIGPAVLVSKVCKGMIENKYGRIINISSIFGQVTRSGRLSYSSSKFGLIGQTKSLALDLAPHNILVNCVAPGFIATELTTRTLGEKGIEEVTQKVPLRRLGTPEEIATGVLFMASKNNTFITGETLTIDGGFLAT